MHPEPVLMRNNASNMLRPPERGAFGSVAPHIRLALVLLTAIVVAVLRDAVSLGAIATLVAVLFPLQRINVFAFVRRFALFFLFIAVFGLIVPWTVPGGVTLLSIGNASYTLDGVLVVLTMFTKGIVILGVSHALLSRLELVVLGDAMQRLGAPRKLTVLFLFTVRYFSVLASEWERMRRAALMRGFRPKMNFRTYRTYAHLMGSLLLRALDRADRVHAAMRCRGFRGTFPHIGSPKLRLQDYAFLALGVLLLSCVATAKYLVLWQ